MDQGVKSQKLMTVRDRVREINRLSDELAREGIALQFNMTFCPLLSDNDTIEVEHLVVKYANKIV